MAKTGRNDPCPCGSGEKYKKCCQSQPGTQVPGYGHMTPAMYFRINAEFDAHNKYLDEWVAEYGHNTIPETVVDQGKKLFVVGDQGYSTDEDPDFNSSLLWLIEDILGEEWLDEQSRQAPSEQHPVARWRTHLRKFEAQSDIDEQGHFSSDQTGIVHAYFHFAYQLYILKRNGCLPQRMIDRLKLAAEFDGARYEVFAFAVLLVAGFEVCFIDDQAPGLKRPEANARHSGADQWISVEAKRRSREPRDIEHFRNSGDTDWELTPGLKRILKKARRKSHDHPFVLFVDLNLPPFDCDSQDNRVLDTVRHEIKKFTVDPKSGRPVFAYVAVTNQPFLWPPEDAVAPQCQMAAAAINNAVKQCRNDDIFPEIEAAILKLAKIPQQFPPWTQAKKISTKVTPTALRRRH